MSFGRPSSVPPVSSVPQAPSRMSPWGSTAGVHATSGTLSTAWWIASVTVMPTECDSHRPRFASQATNARVDDLFVVRRKRPAEFLLQAEPGRGVGVAILSWAEHGEEGL
ncbi:hypothetical protein ABZ281_15995 [Streptomyces sp. NPDC006265]|uniref:hypothetical protein n=1 Tax=Streptomyces sp. NPDC006265 TaxID=3156740 RepID=UPI0033AC6BB2